MDRRTLSKMNTQIYEEASAWFVECRAGDLDDSGRREFDFWLRKSPEHLSAYLEIAAIWNEGQQLDPDSKWSADKLIQHASASGHDTVVPLNGVAETPASVLVSELSRKVPASAAANLSTQVVAVRKPRWGGGRYAVAASTAALALAAGSLISWELSAPTYATALGEQRSIQFEDGSTVELNSLSKIRVQYSKQERDVELIEGQALFHVAHDVSRPFIVAAGVTRVRAVGTQFDVYRKPNGTVVTVVEGRVAVYSTPQRPPSEGAGLRALPEPSESGAGPVAAPASRDRKLISPSGSGNSPPPLGEAVKQTLLTSNSSLMVAAGEQVTVTADSALKSSSPNIAGATAWREREIVFDSATLADVAEEFNRYNQRQLVIEDPSLYGFHISGVFSSTDTDSLIKFLRQRQGVKVTETDSEIRVERGP